MATVTSYTSAHIDALLATINTSIASNTTALASKADLSGGVLTSAQIPVSLVKVDALLINVQDHGVVGDGTTDDTTAIQAVLNSAAVGSTVFFPKSYATTAPIYIPPQIRIIGQHGAHIDQLTKPTFKPKSTFTGAAVILMVDQTTGSYSSVSLEQRIENLTLDLSNISSAASVDAIQAQGYVHGVYIKDVGIYKPPNHGINTVSNGSGTASSWRVVRVHVYNPYGIGINATMTDTTWTDCEVINGAIHGWYIGSSANSIFDGCRAEWNTNDGFNFGAGDGTGAGSGGPIFIGCTTDRNAHNGVSIPSAANGNAPVSFTGCSFRRDGSASTSAGYAGVNINATTQPIILTGCQVYPGTADDGTGLATPQYALSSTSATVQISGGVWHGITEGVHDGGSNVRLSRGINVMEQTGTTSSPVLVTRGLQANGTNGGSLDVPSNLAGIATPASHGLVAWTADPACIQGGSTPGVGVRMMSAVYVPKTVAVTKIFWGTTAAGTTATAGANWIGLYDSSGNRLGSAGIDTRVTMTPQMVSESISSVTLTPGWYWVAWVFNASTTPAVMRSNNLLDASVINAFQTATNFRFCTNLNGQTTMASSLSPASNVASPWALWAALG